ncbi:MAG: hypothetical protein JSW25_09245 [Thermoplasmata archaeon]|nr:MAG: hypothetical protein JSW25_09245 [Thermoplasmata archaeon]
MGDAEDRAKLTHLLGHWIEHNRSHEASYNEWAERARGFGEPSVAEFIEMAVEQMLEADEMLAEALEALTD